jgi:hypothetical protein
VHRQADGMKLEISRDVANMQSIGICLAIAIWEIGEVERLWALLFVQIHKRIHVSLCVAATFRTNETACLLIDQRKIDWIGNCMERMNQRTRCLHQSFKLNKRLIPLCPIAQSHFRFRVFRKPAEQGKSKS